jgi:amino acid transporter
MTEVQADVGGPLLGRPVQPRLKPGAISGFRNLVIGVASTAPAFSLAATLGLLTAAVGTSAPAVLIVSFVPMLCIAIAYAALNRVDPNCGTTFAWGARALGPTLGWLGGWAAILAQLVAVASEAQVAGSYSLQLFGVHAPGELITTVIGVGWVIGLLVICCLGIEMSARTQVLLLACEMLIIVGFAVVALVKVYSGHPGSSHPHLSWFYDVPSAKALTAGLVAGVFIYWGWDTCLSINEETENPRTAPGRAALLSTVVLVLTYVFVTTAMVAFAGPKLLSDNSNDVFAPIGDAVFGSGLGALVILAVLTSTVATTLTTLLPNARTVYAMARAGAAPRSLARINERYQTPVRATLLVGIVSVLLYVGLTLVSTAVLTDTITAIGLQIAFYYGITGLTCIVAFRRRIVSSLRDFIVLGVLPAVGTLTLAYVFVRTTVDNWAPSQSASGGVFGVGAVDIIGVGGLLLGLGLIVIQRRRQPGFFDRAAHPAMEPGA